MAVVIKTGLDPTGANQGTAALQGKLKSDIGGALDNVKAKASEAEKSLKGMLDIGKIQQAAGAFGAVKGIIDQSAVSMGLFSKETAAAASKTLGLAQQGVAAGAAFGPWGAIIGGATGALIGLVTSAKEAEAATRALTETLAAEAAKRAAIQAKELKSRERSAAAVLTQIASIESDISEVTRHITSAAATAEAKATARLFLPDAEEFDKKASAIKLAQTNLNAFLAEVPLTKRSFAEGDEEGQRLIKREEAAFAERKTRLEDALDDAAFEWSQYTVKVDAELANADARIQASTKKQTTAVKTQAKATAVVVDQAALEQLEANATFEAALANSREKWRLADIDEYIAAEQAKIDAATASFLTQEELARTAAATQQAFAEQVYNTQLQLSLDAAAQQKQAIAEVQQATEDAAAAIGDALQGAFVDVGAAAAQTLFDNIEAGNRVFDGMGKSIKLAAAEQLKSIGKTLVGEGLQNALKAAGFAFIPGLQASAIGLAAVGAAQIAAGIGLGATGAGIAQRNASAPTGGSTGTSDSLGARESEASGPRQLSSVKIYLGPEQGMAVFAGDQRGIAEYGRFTTDAQKVGSKAPR